jgi:hypothetical protein
VGFLTTYVHGQSTLPLPIYLFFSIHKAIEVFCLFHVVFHHKILSSWNEGTGTSSGCSELGENYNTESINGVTAIERAYGVKWNEVGLGLNDTDASSKVYSSIVIPNHSMEEVAFNVTDLVKEWVETPSSNYGMLLRNLSESSRRFPNIPLFVSGNSTKVDSRPLLKVYYRH